MDQMVFSLVSQSRSVGKELNPFGDMSDMGQHDPIGQGFSRGVQAVGDKLYKGLTKTKFGGKKEKKPFDPSRILY